MKILSEKEMLNYQGGAKISAVIIATVSGIVVFLLGLYDGITNPKACNIKR